MRLLGAFPVRSCITVPLIPADGGGAWQAGPELEPLIYIEQGKGSRVLGFFSPPPTTGVLLIHFDY